MFCDLSARGQTVPIQEERPRKSGDKFKRCIWCVRMGFGACLVWSSSGIWIASLVGFALSGRVSLLRCSEDQPQRDGDEDWIQQTVWWTLSTAGNQRRVMGLLFPENGLDCKVGGLDRRVLKGRDVKSGVDIIEVKRFFLTICVSTGEGCLHLGLI